MSLYEMVVRNEKGRDFGVRLVRKGESYGLNHCLTHDSHKPLLEFYDLSYPETFGDEGQFVTRYYLHSLFSRLQDKNNAPLCLDGGIPEWTITSKNIRDAVRWGWKQVWASDQ